MTALEDRLRAELRAESELITPGSLGDLRLPGHDGRAPTARHWGALRWPGWPGWTKPLAAAVAAAAVILGTFAVAGLAGGASAPSPPAGYSGAPAYYAYTVPGYIYHYVYEGTDHAYTVLGRTIEVRATATGKVVARVSPPPPYNGFTLLSADASGHEFVFGAEHDWTTSAHTPARIQARTPDTPIRFLMLRISPGGRPHLSTLSLPVGVTPGVQPSIALSPDGTRLAVAGGGGGQVVTVAVITLATGQVRMWYSPAVTWTPRIEANGAWTANGRTLAVSQWYVLRGNASRTTAAHWRPPAATNLYLLDTAAPGNRLADGKLLVLRPPAGDVAPKRLFLTPDGSRLIGITGKSEPLSVANHRLTGAFCVYSARTGALLRPVVPWAWPGRLTPDFPDPTVAWSDRSGQRLIVMQPRDGRNVLGVITGRAFTPGAPAFLAQQPSGYQQLQFALRTAVQVVW